MNKNDISLEMDYVYRGSNNSKLTLTNCENGDIDILSEFGERITSVQTGYGLMRVLENLYNDRLN